MPTEYDEIWKFYGKNRLSTKVVRDGVEYEIYFHSLNSSIPMPANTKNGLRILMRTIVTTIVSRLMIVMIMKGTLTMTGLKMPS